MKNHALPDHVRRRSLLEAAGHPCQEVGQAIVGVALFDPSLDIKQTAVKILADVDAAWATEEFCKRLTHRNYFAVLNAIHAIRQQAAFIAGNSRLKRQVTDALRPLLGSSDFKIAKAAAVTYTRVMDGGFARPQQSRWGGAPASPFGAGFIGGRGF